MARIRQIKAARGIVCGLAILLASLSAAGDGADALGNRLSAVFDADNLPYSSNRGQPEGLDVEVARLIAQELGLALDIAWVDTENTGLLTHLFEKDAPIQLAVGIPIEPRTVEDELPVGEKVAFSIPYASVRYVLVTRKAHRDLADFNSVRLEHVGVEVASVASGVLWDRGFLLHGMESQQRLLEALARGEVGCAVLWNNAEWLIHQDGGLAETLKVQAARPEIPGLSWNLAAAVGLDNRHLLAGINEAIQTLRERGAFRPLFKKYHLPYFEPVSTEEKGNEEE